MRRLAMALLVPALAVFTACGTDTREQEEEESGSWPTESWQTTDPASQGFDAAALERVSGTLAADLPFLDSLLVIRNGYIVHEQYFNGFDAATLHTLASVTKSWTSAAAGIASGRQGAPDLDAPLSTLLPDYFEGGRNGDKAGITYRHLLQMRSGIEFSEDTLDSGGYGSYEDLAAQDLTAWGLGLPAAYAPGESWRYSTLDSQLVSAVLHQAMGVPLEELARESLFRPLGITEYTWFADRAGTTIGGQQLSLAPRDMAKLGLLYLEGGRWEDEQLIPAAWIAESTRPQGTRAYVPFSEEEEVISWYGYHWWTWGPEWFGGYSGLAAQGYGGQQVLILPELDLIIVTTADNNVDTERAAEQAAAIYAFLLEQLFPTLTDAKWDFDR